MFVFKFMYSFEHKHTNLLNYAKNYLKYFYFFTAITIPVAQTCGVTCKSVLDSKSLINLTAFS